DGKFAGAHLVSIHGLRDELDGVRLTDDGTVEIGPITWFHHVTTSPVIQATVPTLGEACDTPGGPQLRVSGTIGGNICNAATSADTASTLYAYGALLDVQSVRGTRTIPIEEWYAGPGRSTKERDEVLVRIRIPRDHYEGFTGHYFKYGKRRALEIATMGCCCLVKLSADKSTIDDIRLAVGVAAPTPIRARNAEDAVRGLPVAEAAERIGELAQADTHPRDSWRASKDFRLQLIKEMSRRSLLEAARKGGARV
ncbi:MAG: FAD binding domain-containing protein, partial [Coriobacteriales bacterium]|nr:FAD binding domain-containing protein [Coriobacteriales bacterium]